MPVYKCLRCGRTVDLPEGRYYCRVCGPSAVMVKSSEKRKEIVERWVKGVRGEGESTPAIKAPPEEIVSKMCDLLTADSGAGKVLASALYSVKTTIESETDRKLFILELASALNRRGLLRNEDIDKFHELGYKYMETS